MERVCEKPARCIDVIRQSVPCLRGNRRVMRLDGLGDAIEDFLDGAHADGDPEYRGAHALHHPPTIAIGAGQFPPQGTASWPVPRGACSRHLRCTPAPTRWTPALMQDPMDHLHRYWRALDDLVRIVRSCECKRHVPTCTLHRPQFLDHCGWQEHLAMARMARFATRCAAWGGGCPLPWLFVRRVR